MIRLVGTKSLPPYVDTLVHSIDETTNSTTTYIQIWTAYGIQFLMLCAGMCEYSHGETQTITVLIFLINIPTFVTTILMHTKLANGGLSWMDVFIPLIVQHSLFVCAGLVGIIILIND